MFCGDNKYYRIIRNWSKDDVADYKRRLAKRCFKGICSYPKLFRADQVASAYLTIKGRCLDLTGKGLQCEKEHAHEREIVSNYNEPAKRALQGAAKALRIAKRLSKDVSWTIWRSAALPQVLRQRAAKLQVIPKYRKRCPCNVRAH